jgi:uncharacterized protein
MAEQDLAMLLRRMEPQLHDAPYGFGVAPATALPFAPFATVAEVEGQTVVAPLADLLATGMRSDPWARISLTVHSDLQAVGLTAAFATALAAVGISANVIAGHFHDHIFVPWDKRAAAVAALQALADA